VAGIATIFAIVVTVYFWWENTKGVSGIERKSAAHHEAGHRDGGAANRLVHLHALLRHSLSPPFPYPRNLHFSPNALGWLAHTVFPQIGIVAIFIALGHSVLAMSGEESLAQVYRELKAPAPNLKKAGLVIFVYSLVFTSLVSFFAVMIISGRLRQHLPGKSHRWPVMSLQGPLIVRLIFHGFVVVVGTLILAGAVNTPHSSAPMAC